MASIYKFKYERNGKVYASKDMLPSEDDTLLIDRDVLEGKKEPGEPESGIDNEASIAALKEALEMVVSDEVGTEAVDAEIEFDHCSADLFYDMFDRMDNEAMKILIDGMLDGTVLIKHKGTMTVRVDDAFYEAQESGVFVHVVEIPNVLYRLGYDIDAETGGVKHWADIGWSEFTGKVIVNFPVEPEPENN